MQNLVLNAILYFFIPLWITAGFCDWLCHRVTRISETSGMKESVLHLLMIGEVGLPVLACLFLEINALVLLFVTGAFLAHEATVWWDLRYTDGKRRIPPEEQMIHSFQELIPLILLVLLVLLHWEEFTALLALNRQADFSLAWKKEPLPAAYIATVLSCAAFFVGLPFLEELWRCYRAQAGGRAMSAHRQCMLLKRVTPKADHTL